MKKGGGILKNTLIVGALTALSRVLGLVREMLQSRLVGAGVEQSAFTLAFAIPNMARKLFGEGALTAAFVPIFKSEVDAEGIEKASRLARAVMTTVLAMLVALVALSSGALEAVSFALSSREGADTGRISLTCNLVGTLLPYMVFICGAAFGMGVLNSLGRFKAAGFMPALLNICWISALATLFFFPSLSAAARVKWIARAILAAGAVQMAFMMVAMAKAGVSPRPLFSGWGGEKVRKVWRNIAIGALGAGAVQINYMLDQTLAQMASPWAAGVIGYAERLMDLPLGVIGVAFGTVLLPAFAGLFSKGDIDGARAALSSSLQSLLFAMLPAAAGLHGPDVVDGRKQEAEHDEAACGQDCENHGVGVDVFYGDVAPYGERPRADDLAHRRDQGQGQREPHAGAKPVRKGIDHAVLARERLGPAEDDAVHDNQRDEDA